MDGGGVAVRDGQVASAWRRDHDIYLAMPGKPEVKIGSGQDVAFAANSRGFYTAWSTPSGIELLAPGSANPSHLSSAGAFPAMVRPFRWRNAGRMGRRRHDRDRAGWPIATVAWHLIFS